MKKIALTLAAAAIAFATPALASSAAVDLTNDSSASIYQIYMTDVDHPELGRDLLGNETLPTGYMTEAMEPSLYRGYCRYDLIVTFDDGSTSTLNDFNACAALAVTIKDRSFVIEDVNGHLTNRRGILN